MKKKSYEVPSVEVERFGFEDVLTTSTLGTGDGMADSLNGTDIDDEAMIDWES